jgi:hypothetical protein
MLAGFPQMKNQPLTMPLLVLLLALIRLPDGGHTEDTLRLVTVADTLHYVQVADYAGRVERWPLPYPVYRFQTGDINGDGRTDVLVGVIKSTRYDPQVARRLFIFKVYKDRYIRPLWMGSRLSHPLVDFRFAHIDGQPRVLTIERDTTPERYLIAVYRWRSFGLDFVAYHARGIPLDEARQRLEGAPISSGQTHQGRPYNP